MEEIHLKAFEALPHASTCRLIDFEKADVVPGFASKTFFLLVAGTKPWATLKVELHPLIYIGKPDYRGIEVVACQDGIALPTARALSRRARYHPFARRQGHRGGRRVRQQAVQRAVARGPAGRRRPAQGPNMLCPSGA